MFLPLVWNANGQCSDMHPPALVADYVFGLFDPTAKQPLAAVDKVHTVVVDVEPHQIATCSHTLYADDDI